MEFNLADLWEAVADTVPERPALIDGGRHLTFAELDQRANQLAHALSARGVQPGDHVALFLHNCAEYIEGMLAAFKIRAVPINVNYRYVEEELRYLLDDAHAVAIIHHDAFSDRVDAILDDLPRVTTRLIVTFGSSRTVDDSGASGSHIAESYEAAIATQTQNRDFAPRAANDAYVLYTGGTTGMPKGVVWRHEDVFFAAMGGGRSGGAPITAPEEIAERCQRGAARLVVACPLMHGTAHWMAMAMLFGGGCVITARTDHFDADALLDLIANQHANYVVIVGDAYAIPMADAFAKAASTGTAHDASDAVSVIVSGGAVLSPSVKQSLLASLPHAMIVDGYGASETGGQGRTIAGGGETLGTTTFLVDDDTEILDAAFQPCAVGRIGRVARRGHVPLGYFNDPEKSATTFFDTPAGRWAIPGDHGVREADGSITLLGRGSLCINTGGEKVYPDEVESQLKAHAAVFDALVLGIPDARFGQQVCALVQLRPDAECDADQLQEHLRPHLAGYKIPRTTLFVTDVQRSPSGKPDYQWAAEYAANTLATTAE